MNIAPERDYLNSNNPIVQSQTEHQSNYIENNNDEIANQASQCQCQISQIKIEQCPPQNTTINLKDKLRLFANKSSFCNLPSLYDQFIETGDINVKSSNGIDYTLLHYAILVNDIEITLSLLQAGADANATTYWGATPLHNVTHPHIVNLLIQYGADIHAKDNEGNTPLHHFWLNETKEIVKVLLKHKADVNAKNNTGETLFDIAAQKGHFEIISLLLNESKVEDITRKDKHGDTALHHAIDRNNIKVTRLLISEGADINAKNNKKETPLNKAAKKSLNDIVELLLNTEKIEDVNAKDINGKTPLHYAVDNRNTKMSGLLLSANADTNAKDLNGNTPLHHAVLNRDKGYITLKASVVDIYTDDVYYYHGLINDLCIAILLINNGANINATNNKGNSPLYCTKNLAAKDLYRLLKDKSTD